jgi:rhamnosyl/mannosyltransferase
VRITYLNKWYLPHVGGVEQVVDSLARLMAADGHDVRAVVASRDRVAHRRVEGGVEILELPTFGIVQKVPIAPGYLWFPTRHDEIWHLQEPFPLGTLAVLLRALTRKGARIVVSWHSDVVRQRLLRPAHEAIARAVLDRATIIHVATQAHLDGSRILPRYRDKVEVIPYMVDVERYRHDATRPLVRAIRAWAGAAPVALYVGRLVYYKGLDYLLDAVARVPELRIVIAGDGVLRESLRAHAEQLGLRDRIYWTGALSEEDVSAVYSGADFFVLPSTHRTEAFGLVQVEAMAAGLPVVSTRLGTGVEIVNEDGVSGILVAPADAAALAEALRLLATDGAARARLSAGALRRAADFTPARLAPRYRALYERVAQCRR